MIIFIKKMNTKDEQKTQKPLVYQSSEVFASIKVLAPGRESEIQVLQANIGQLTMENNFLSKVLGR